MKWRDAKNDPPPKSKDCNWSCNWSEKDYFLCCRYSYEIGRMKNGRWVDMYNRPVDCILWCEITGISDEHKGLF